MKRPLSTLEIFVYQFLTLGIYFLVWCYRLGKELNTGLKRKAVPSMWWFLVPGGNYYWIWGMSKALDTATGNRIKQADVFLWYLVVTMLPLSLLQFIPDGNSAAVENHADLVLIALGILLAFLVLIEIAAHAIYISYLQKQLNHVRGVS